MPVLSAKYEAFAQHWAAHRDTRGAYRHAFRVRAQTSDKSVQVASSHILNEAHVQARIAELQAGIDATNPALYDVARVQELWQQIALADPDELIGLRVGACRRCWGEGHGYQWKEYEYLEALAEAERNAARDPAGAAQGLYPLPDPGGGFGYQRTAPVNADCPGCEGEGVERVIARDTSDLSPGARALYGGIKQTRNGVEIIIADRMKALENLTRMIGGFNRDTSGAPLIRAMLDVVQLEKLDPLEASRAYMQMIQHMPAAPAKQAMRNVTPDR